MRFNGRSSENSAFRIPLATFLANQANLYGAEIAKDVMPTIVLLAIRLPSGAAAEKPHETANNIYAVLARTVRATFDEQADEVLALGDVLAVPLWHEHVLHGIEDATLLRVTDEAIMSKFRLLRQG